MFGIIFSGTGSSLLRAHFWVLILHTSLVLLFGIKSKVSWQMSKKEPPLKGSNQGERRRKCHRVQPLRSQLVKVDATVGAEWREMPKPRGKLNELLGVIRVVLSPWQCAFQDGMLTPPWILSLMMDSAEVAQHIVGNKREWKEIREFRERKLGEG